MKNSSEAKLLLVMGAFVLVGGGALVWINKGGSIPLPNNPAATPMATPTPIVWDETKFKQAIADARHVRGPENAPFTVVEFADFECPSCRRAYNTSFKKLEKTGRVRFIFRHFPWPYHTNAVPAATACEAAGEQGKFWPMYDALFEGEEVELGDSYFTELAKKIGLDVSRFDKDRTGTQLLPRILADKNVGEKLGVASTPTIVIRDNKTGKFSQAVGAGDFEKFVPILLGTAAPFATLAPPAPVPASTPGPAPTKP